MWSQIALWLLRSSSGRGLNAFAKNASEILKGAHFREHQEAGLPPQCILLVLEAPRVLANS